MIAHACAYTLDFIFVIFCKFSIAVDIWQHVHQAAAGIKDSSLEASQSTTYMILACGTITAAHGVCLMQVTLGMMMSTEMKCAPMIVHMCMMLLIVNYQDHFGDSPLPRIHAWLPIDAWH